MTRTWAVLFVLAAVVGSVVAPRVAAREAHADEGLARRQVEALDRIARSLEKISDCSR